MKVNKHKSDCGQKVYYSTPLEITTLKNGFFSSRISITSYIKTSNILFAS
ncbi:hypothetical protein SAMN05444672_13821 [Bacillus sp. OK838]|nr:hypothetical protein SAMN05444672_13821 [Bacillus sp. OK838]